MNVGGLLGELAPKLAPEQLELLFRHFGACTAWPAPMALRAMDLLSTLAKGDEQVLQLRAGVKGHQKGTSRCCSLWNERSATRSASLVAVYGAAESGKGVPLSAACRAQLGFMQLHLGLLHVLSTRFVTMWWRQLCCRGWRSACSKVT